MTLVATLQTSIRIALRALRINKLRSALTMLGIIIGVGAVITMIAVGGGAQARVQQQIASLGSNLMIIIPGSTTTSGVRLGTGQAQTLTEDDALALTREIPSIRAAAPSLRGSGQIVFGNNNWAVQMQGVWNDYFEAREWPVIAGRMFEDSEISGAGKVVILGQSTARQLFGDADPIDQVVRINKVPMTVIGILDRKGQSMFGQDQDDIAFVPLSTGRNRIFGSSQGRLKRVGNINVKVRDGFDMDQAEEDIRALLRQRHRLQAGAADDFTVRNMTEILQTQEESSRVMTLLLAAVASVSLLVGGIGIMNIMLVSVTERTREIGLRMAVGARAHDILTQFLIEAVTLSLIGGFLGIVVGGLGAWAVAALAGWPTQLSTASIVLAVGFAGAIGVFFGFYPARKASQLLPIQALRYE
ncbi:FtsX-like permease family protein [Imbroritus primus]|uniref:FtsX-like permease family protein n=1 Tax=Imbroritus primus TaxID=3058603 RepID=A0ACD3SS99_9BURK|nr:FtsX-like permease family protein [Burkholderiaceae bacterium PBA]